MTGLRWLLRMGLAAGLLVFLPLAGLAIVSSMFTSYSQGLPGVGVGLSEFAVRTIPQEMQAAYLSPETREQCPGLSPAVLAGIGQIETRHNTATGTSSAGAQGPMQFMPATWAAYGVDANGDGQKDVWDPADAVAGAANYLCANGGDKAATLEKAIWNYNHAWWYVCKGVEGCPGNGTGDPNFTCGVLCWAERYEAELPVLAFASGAGTLQWPVGKADSYISTCYMRDRGTYLHSGLDIAAPEGTPVMAAASGIAEMVRYYDPIYGLVVTINHGGGLWTMYGHNSSLHVSPGQAVVAGQVIARVGNTGRSFGNHLHFNVTTSDGIRSYASGETRNPLDYLPDDGRSLSTSAGYCIRGSDGIR